MVSFRVFIQILRRAFPTFSYGIPPGIAHREYHEFLSNRFSFHLKIERTTGLIFISIQASVVGSEGRRSKAYISRGKRQNAFNTNLSSGQQQLQYASSPHLASFVPGYYQGTGKTNPDASPELARERSRNVQGSRGDVKNPASMVFNDNGSGARRPQNNVNAISGSPLKNEKSGFQNRIVEGTITDSTDVQQSEYR